MFREVLDDLGNPIFTLNGACLPLIFNAGCRWKKGRTIVAPSKTTSSQKVNLLIRAVHFVNGARSKRADNRCEIEMKIQDCYSWALSYDGMDREERKSKYRIAGEQCTDVPFPWLKYGEASVLCKPSQRILSSWPAKKFIWPALAEWE